MAEEQFEKTSKKANRWFRAAIVFALLYGATFSLFSIFNWIFFFAAAYSFFMSYYKLPVQPRIFQGARKQTWTGPGQFNTASTAQPPAIAKAKRFVFMVVGGVFAVFMFFFVVWIMNPDVAQQQSQESQSVSEDLSDNTELSSSQLSSKGNEFFNDQQYDSADAYYDLALAADPQNMEAVYGKGIVLYKGGNADEAMTLFRRSYEGGYRFVWLSWVLADMYDKRGETSQAIALYKESVSLDSSYTDSYKRLAEIDPSNRDVYLQLAEKHATN